VNFWGKFVALLRRSGKHADQLYLARIPKDCEALSNAVDTLITTRLFMSVLPRAFHNRSHYEGILP
jgi:hypothetical protein